MSCGGGHIGFPIGRKNRNLVKDIPMIFHLQFGLNQFISFREEDLWNFSQSEDIIGPGSHVEYPTGTKNSKFVEDHTRNIPAKFGTNWPSGFGEEAWNVKSLQTTDDGRRTPSDGNSSPGPNFGYENYLSIIKNFEQRRRLSKLRISAHKLQIEIGRVPGYSPGKPNLLQVHFGSGRRWDPLFASLYLPCKP
jgi:hypothetical protein